MADVSHELGALRFVMDSPLSSKVAMFNNQAQQVHQANLLNPFSSANDGRSSPKPTFTKEEYGKPLAGSLTEMRGQKANMNVFREMLELCQIIDSEGYKVNDEPKMRVIPFGELFNIYNYISDKVVGILLRARKYKYVQFEGEMLFQRRDDDVPVFLLKPIQELRAEINAKIEEIKQTASAAPPQATSLLMDKGAHQQKLQEAALNGSRRSMKSRSASPATSRASSRAGSKAATPTLEESNSKASTATAPTPIIAATTEAVAANDVSVKPETAETTEAPKDDITPAPKETSSENGAVESKQTDVSSKASDLSITINDLPTIVIEPTPASDNNTSDSSEITTETSEIKVETTNST